MKTSHYILLLFIVLIGVSCTDLAEKDINVIVSGRPATVTFALSASSNIIQTRAVATEADEKKVHNLYVLVFDENGKRTSGQFFNVDELGDNKLTLLTESGTKRVYGIANLNLDMMKMEITTLDAVASESELMELNSSLLQNAIERGNNFLMSGWIGDEKGDIKNVDIKEGENGLLGTIQLNRVDSKITFEISTPSNVTFIAKDWRVYNVPLNVSLFARENKDRFTNASDYFDTKPYNFEGEGDLKGRTFGFYLLENTHTPPKLIDTELKDQYACRELQKKNEVTGKPNQTHENGDFIYAPSLATYVKIRGIVSYKNSAGVDLLADVEYTVHLGYRNNDANDYDVLRNSLYTYKITINSVNNIILEVDTGQEKQPGAEGAIIQGNATYSFDAHYEAKTITFSATSIVDHLDWYVKTPFSEGFSKDSPKDKDWILFRLNEVTRSNNGNNPKYFYSNNLNKFPGEEHCLSSKSFDEFKKDKSLLLNVDQLLYILKKCKEYYENTSHANDSYLYHLIDNNNNITFTAFINENYYDFNPEETVDPSKTPVDLWKRFVNQPERIMNIISEKAYSPDGNSMMSKSVISFRQASIQTMYNTELDTDQLKTAWGSEMIQDEIQYQFGSNSKYPSETNNGRSNCITLWGINGNTSWSTYVNSEDGTLKSSYKNAQYACLRLNRDNNGNGKIDKEEIRWYLTSINQLTDLWIGENSFDPAARLYDKATWDQTNQWYASSSFRGHNNPTVLWSSEGSSIGPLNNIGNTRPLYYRAARNLGIPANSDDIPQDFAHYDRSTGIISLDGLNYKSIRGYKAVKELREHHEREADNMPRRRFQVQKGSIDIWKNWVEIRDLINIDQSPAKSLGEGWRVPNQRELALMQSRIGGDNLWHNNNMSRTRFSFNPAGSYRHGFSVSTNGSILYLINNSEEKGGVRCVRDLE